jgi:iron complex transport system substrate-binding protein
VKPRRIVSLLPSCTEIVCALDGAGRLVGRSHECDFPEEIRHLPVCTSAKIDSRANSAAIDKEVKTLLQNALSLYDVDLDRLQTLQPDLILTQAQCEVCAVSLPAVEAALSTWTGTRPQILSLSPKRVPDIWDDIRRVAEALGDPEAGKQLLRSLKQRFVVVIEKACVISKRPSVACIEWIEPLMAAGNWVPDLVDLAGGLNLFGESGKHSPWLNWEAVREHDPEVIIVMPCGFDLARTRAEMPALLQRPDWAKLRAVKKQRVYLADGNQFFNRPGPRIVESLEIIAEILHPQLFQFSHENKGWEKL